MQTGTAFADQITVEGKTYQNVLIFKSSSRYYIRLPKEGRVISVPTTKVDESTVTIVDDPYYRDELMGLFDEALAQTEAEAKRKAAIPTDASAFGLTSRNPGGVDGSPHRGAPAPRPSQRLEMTSPPLNEYVIDDENSGGRIVLVLGMLMYGVGGLAGFVGSAMVLIKAFRESALWGLVSFFIPFAIFVFVAKNWEEAKTGFGVALAGGAIAFLGVIVTFAGAVGMAEVEISSPTQAVGGRGSTSPEGVVESFVEAANSGSVQDVKPYLTTKAWLGFSAEFNGFGESDPDYQVFGGTVTGIEASVPARMSEDGKTQEMDFKLRQEGGRWLVYGIHMTVDGLTINMNFENPQQMMEDMLREFEREFENFQQ
jgi:hypothetical protein